MTKNLVFRQAIRRLIVVTVFSIVIIAIANEAFYLLQKEPHERAPQQVELVIPLGTAEMVSRGEPVASIPEEMVFMVGDTLLVKNEDSVSHQLGPVWIPANASASLSMDNANRYLESCSFQPSQYLGLDVRTPITLGTRLQALVVAGPATITFLFIYSILVFPLEKKKPSFRNPKVSGYIRFRKDHEAGQDSESGTSPGTGDV